MFQNTDAIALRVTPFSNTSHVVFWLTPDSGRIATVMKGTQRPKSSFLGQFDIFYTCELVYYSREKDGLHVMKECYPAITRKKIRSDWRAAGCASYVCDLVWHVSGSGGHSEGLYQLLSDFLNHIAEASARTAALFWFELKLLDLLGFRPRLDRCSVCHMVINAERPVILSARTGGIICTQCIKGENSTNTHVGPDKMIFRPDHLAILRNWLDAPSPRSANNTKCSKDHLFTFSKLLDIFIAFHIDLRLTSRKIALELLS